MENSTRDRVREANAQLLILLSRAREALAGRQDFTVKEIRAISEPLGQMQPIVSRATDLRATDIELDADLKAYAGTLKELQNALEQIRFMFVARLAHLDAARNHMETINLWATAFKQTR